MNDKKRKKWNKKTGRDEKRNPNAGVSLLEVIIAVSIFSITAIILLQGFVTSSRINRKSDLYLEATTMAQNLMEEIKSRKFEEVSLAFNYPIDSTTGDTRINFLNTQKNRIENGTLGIREVTQNTNDKGDTTYSDVSQYKDGVDESKVTASVISTDGGKTYKFNPRKKGKNASKYYFELSNVNADHESFDALVEFDGSTDSGYKKGTTTSVGDGKNDYLAPSISDMNSKTNAFLIMPTTWDEDAMKAMVAGQKQVALDAMNTAGGTTTDSSEYQELDWQDVYKHTKRTLYIKIEESGGTVKAEARYVLCAYNYKKDGGTQYETMSLCPCKGKGEEEDVSGCFCTYKSAYVPFYSSEAGESLKNIFVFYYPNYNSVSSVNPLDKIVLDNTTNYEVNFYVTKQRDDKNNVPTYAQELQYRMSLTIQENPAARNQTNWNTNPSLYKAVTKLRSNLDYDISKADDVQNRLKVNQMSLTYQSVNNNGQYGAKIVNNTAKKVLNCNSLDDREAEDRIYTAKVSVYREGAAEKNFPEEDLVVTLDGAKED